MSTLTVPRSFGSVLILNINTVQQPLQYINVTWVTRDMQASWKTRDMQASWKTRDENATWKTRG